MSSYSVSTRWISGRRGETTPDNGAGPVTFSSPPEFQGESGLWTPEHFFVAAVASCFVTTFKAIAEFSRFSFQSLDVSVEGVLEKVDSGYKFTRVIVKPKLVVATEADMERGTRLLEKSERACLVSRSLSSDIRLQPEVTSVTDSAS